MKLTHKQIDLIKHCLEDCANSDGWAQHRAEIYQMIDIFENRKVFVTQTETKHNNTY